LTTPEDISRIYNKTAQAYAEKFFNELDNKPFDRFILSAFAEKHKHKNIIDFGCGPGQSTRFLSDQGAVNIIGTDISTEMISTSKQLSPHLKFEVANLLALPYPDKSFSAALAFYAIVHFNSTQLLRAFLEINRVLQMQSEFLFSFHIGNETVKADNFLGGDDSLDFRFFDVHKVLSVLHKAGFKEESVVERWPYREVEYPSKRAYIWAHKTSDISS
jgi:ubiquinone/menaquinone biosynthesis C-methylase UbiE